MNEIIGNNAPPANCPCDVCRCHRMLNERNEKERAKMVADAAAPREEFEPAQC